MNDPSAILAGRRVLVADDESFSLSIVSRMLREMGCTDLLAADSGPKCAVMLRADSPPGLKLAVLDFNMTEINGLQILKAIRTGKTAVPRDLPTVMLTGTADTALVSAAVALDIGAFVVKPVSKVMLAQRLTKVLGDQRLVKPIAIYEQVDIDTISNALAQSHKPVGGAKARNNDRVELPNGVKLRLESVPVGAILAEDIRGPDGELLLGRGTPLSDRFLSRLRNLSGAAKLDYLIVQIPKKGM